MQDERNLVDAGSGRWLGQMIVILIVAVLLVNVPISRRGAGLIHSIPDATPVVIYEGMALQGSGPDVYILQNHQLRPFAGPDTYRYFRDRYHLDVHTVTDHLLQQFGRGRPIRRLVSCRDGSEVYALENDTRRQVELPADAGRANPWDTVVIVPCRDLRAIPLEAPLPGRDGEAVLLPARPVSLTP